MSSPEFLGMGRDSNAGPGRHSIRQGRDRYPLPEQTGLRHNSKGTVDHRLSGKPMCSSSFRA